MDNPHLATVDEVLEEELADVAQRRDYLRRTNQLSQHSPKLNGRAPASAGKDLVGLALSGGGVRSASFCTGILQSFYRRGVMKYVDFMSAVSGGGYAAAFLSTLVQNTERPIDWTAESSPVAPSPAPSRKSRRGSIEPPPERLPITAGPDGRQPPFIQQLAGRMPRMGQPLRFIERLAWGIITINALILSGLVMVGALVAYLMRLTDGQSTRIYLRELGFQTDLGIAFFPAFITFLVWTVTHFSAAVIRRGKDTLRKVARSLFVLTVVCVLLGIATVLGIGDIDLTWLERYWGVSPALTEVIRRGTALLSTALAAIFAAAFLPYLGITRLIQSGVKRDASTMERAVYYTVSNVLIFGTPLVVYYVLAKENISGYQQSRPDRNALVVPAIKDWIEFGRRIQADAAESEGVLSGTFSVDGAGSAKAGQTSEAKTPAVNIADHIWSATLGVGDPAWDPMDTSRVPQTTVQHPLERIVAKEDEAADRYRTQWMWRAWLSMFAGPLIPTYRDHVADGLYTRHAKEWAVRNIDRHVLSNPTLYRLAESSIADPAPARRTDSANVRGVAPQSAAAGADSAPSNRAQQGAIGSKMDSSASVLFSRIEKMRKDVINNVQDADSRAALDKLWTIDPGGFLVQQVDHLRAQMATATEWNSKRREWAVRRSQDTLTSLETDLKRWEDALFAVRGNNLAMLVARYSREVVQDPSETVFSYVVYRADQQTRLSYALWAGIVFLALSLLINLNSTSMHGFFRDQLAEIWTPTGADVPLANLQVCEKGAAIPLWSAAVNRSVRRVVADEQKISTFQFSPDFCGSRWLGFVPTKLFRHGDMTVGEAMALSGAALTPSDDRNVLLRLFLTITNFRMGQWVPTPSEMPTKSDRAFPLRLFWNRCCTPSRQRSLSFLTDGGMAENTGVGPLLLRRCRLIIAIDGSHDPDSRFLDLAKLMRMADSRYGVKFTSLQSAEQPVDLAPIRPSAGRCPAHVVVARIQYPPTSREKVASRASEGVFVYVKPSFTGDESAHLMLYRDDCKTFPHDSTIDQFFDPERFEVYRQLGEHIGEAVWRELWLRPGDEVGAGPSPEPTQDLWTWVPRAEKTQSQDTKSATENDFARAMRQLKSSEPRERRTAINWFADFMITATEEMRAPARQALEEALNHETDPDNKELLEKVLNVAFDH